MYITLDIIDRTDTPTVTERTGTEEMNLINKPPMLNDLTNTRGGSRDTNSSKDKLAPEHINPESIAFIALKGTHFLVFICRESC